MAIFLTGSTGYIGAHVAANLLQDSGAPLNLLVRARIRRKPRNASGTRFQLHLDFKSFYEHLQSRIRVFRGDLTDERFGLSQDEYDRLVHTTDSVIHCAASLNRRSEKSCMNVNLRGTPGSHQTGSAGGSLPRLAALQSREHGRGCGQAPGRSGHGRQFDRLEPFRLRSICAHQEIFEYMIHQLLPDAAQDNFSPQHRAWRQPPR